MPDRDGTGPDGKGKMTGRGLGNCNLNNKERKNTYPKNRGRRNRRLRN